MIKEYATKIIVSENSVEYLKYEKPIEYGYKYKGRPPRPMCPNPDDKMWEMNKLRNRKNSNIRATIKMRRLVENNFCVDTAVFITLTFSEDITDVSVGSKEFKCFIQRLRGRFNGFKYVAVVDFTKKERIHYHMIADVPNNENQISKIWGMGWIKIKPMYDLNRMVGYLCKHLFSRVEDSKMYGKKAFFSSRNLKKPKILVGEEAENFIKARSRVLRKNQLSEKLYDTPYNGKLVVIKYKKNPIRKLPKRKVKKKMPMD